MDYDFQLDSKCEYYWNVIQYGLLIPCIVVPVGTNLVEYVRYNLVDFVQGNELMILPFWSSRD